MEGPTLNQDKDQCAVIDENYEMCSPEYVGVAEVGFDYKYTNCSPQVFPQCHDIAMYSAETSNAVTSPESNDQVYFTCDNTVDGGSPSGDLDPVYLDQGYRYRYRIFTPDGTEHAIGGSGGQSDNYTIPDAGYGKYVAQCAVCDPEGNCNWETPDLPPYISSVSPAQADLVADSTVTIAGNNLTGTNQNLMIVFSTANCQLLDEIYGGDGACDANNAINANSFYDVTWNGNTVKLELLSQHLDLCPTLAPFLPIAQEIYIADDSGNLITSRAPFTINDCDSLADEVDDEDEGVEDGSCSVDDDCDYVECENGAPFCDSGVCDCS
jgi:hypothetical protein